MTDYVTDAYKQAVSLLRNSKVPKAIKAMHLTYGFSPDHTCGGCTALGNNFNNQGVWFRECTYSQGAGWTPATPACGKYHPPKKGTEEEPPPGPDGD